MPAREPAPGSPASAQGVGATLGVIALIAVVVVAALLLSCGGDEARDSADPASGSTQPAGEQSTMEVPTISSEDFPAGAPTAVPDLPTDLPTDLSSAPPRKGHAAPTGPDLSGLPTNPSDYESWFTDQLEQMNP